MNNKKDFPEIKDMNRNLSREEIIDLWVKKEMIFNDTLCEEDVRNKLFTELLEYQIKNYNPASLDSKDTNIYYE